MYKDHRVAVVIPIHNEEGHIERAVSQVPAFVDLVIAVDDASTDETGTLLAAVGRDGMVALRHDRNRGVGAATKTGYAYALRAEAALIAVMDGDCQMDGADLHRLLDRAVSGVDYVKGNRFLHHESIGCMPFTRYVGNVVLSRLSRWASGFIGSLDAQCGYTVIRRSSLAAIEMDSLYDRYGFPNEMLFAVCRAGLRVESVPVRTIYASEQSGINPLFAVPTILWLIARSFIRRSICSVRSVVPLVRQIRSEPVE